VACLSSHCSQSSRKVHLQARMPQKLLSVNTKMLSTCRIENSDCAFVRQLNCENHERTQCASSLMAMTIISLASACKRKTPSNMVNYYAITIPRNLLQAYAGKQKDTCCEANVKIVPHMMCYQCCASVWLDSCENKHVFFIC